MATDHALKEHIVQCTRVLSADGASKERRALLLAVQEVFKNVVLVVRDPAHALRIAVKNPLHCDEVFGDVWEQLFDKRHALVPDLTHSKTWQRLLQQIQRHVLRIPGRSRPLAVVLKHLRFAKQRFNSTADPVAKVAFMLLPIATLLAFASSDGRRSICDKARAQFLLNKAGHQVLVSDWLVRRLGYHMRSFLAIIRQDGS